MLHEVCTQGFPLLLENNSCSFCYVVSESSSNATGGSLPCRAGVAQLGGLQ